ncbi:hypothetical protein LINPERHAP2_LOCUS25663, partial [Linum perenne]
MADGKDRISELPDEILLCILCRLQSKKEAARSIAISKRWGTVWRSYPIVEYDRWKDLQNFCDASINRFSRDGLLLMKILKLELRGFIDRFTRFEKVHLRFWQEFEVRFEVDHDVHPVPIKELEISTLGPSSSDTDQRALLDGVLWACRPRLFSVSKNLSYTDSNGLIE